MRLLRPKIIRPIRLRLRRKKKALVLSGGGSKGAFQVGALKRWILEENCRYDVLCGISVGALNAAFLSQFKPVDQAKACRGLEAMWTSLQNNDVWRKHFLGEVAALWKPSVYDSTPLMNLVRTQFDPAKARISGALLRVVAVSWNTGALHVADQSDKNIAEWVLASSSFPCFLAPIKIDDQMWSDGGLREVTPLGEAIRAGAEEIDIIMCSNPNKPSNWGTEGKNAIHYALRTLDLMSEEIIRKDVRVCGLKNDLAEIDPKYSKVKIRLVQPSQSLTGNSLEFNPESTNRMMAIGYEDSANPVILNP